MTITLAGQLGIELDLSNPAWLHEARDPHTGKWIKAPADTPGPLGSSGRYVVPDPARLFSKSGYRNPADHPFWREHPVSPANIVAAYDAADEGTREQGRRWYSDVHDLATKITGGDPEKGGILLSTYSPQTSWPVNMFNAARSAATGKAVGKGEGMMVTDQQQAKAQAALDGEGIETLMKTAKTHSFGALIRTGDDTPDDPYGHVVVDTHAVNVALGGTMRGRQLEKAPINDARQHEYVADQYRRAAKIISEREGRLMRPHQLQAITWLAQQRANQALDAAELSPLQKGRITMVKNAWARWMKYADDQGIPLVVGSTSLTADESLFAQVVELIAGDSIWAQLHLALEDGSIGGQLNSPFDLAFNPAEPRDARGRWTRGSLAEQLTGQRHYPVIGPEHARGNSRAVSHEEFQRLARLGNQWIDRAKRDASPTTGLDRNWGQVKERAFKEAQQPWGGATINTHTGDFLPGGADLYALSVKPRGMTTISVPETASQHEFEQAMDQARQLFGPVLQRAHFHLGVFHDDDHNRIDIDPVAIVDSLDLVEQVGAYTHAVGGAYHFKSGDGFWPPHVAQGADMANDDGQRVHWAGPGQWRSYADAVQDPEPTDDDGQPE